MKKVSLGIILEGDPSCVQKSGPVLKFFNFFFKYGWLAAAVATGVAFVLCCADFSEKKLFVLLGCFVFAAVLLVLGEYFWGNDKERCPYCHHFLSMKQISEDRVVGSDSRAISHTVDEYHSGMAFDLNGNSAYMVGKTSYKENGLERTTTYVHARRCEICGSICKVEHKKTTQSF